MKKGKRFQVDRVMYRTLEPVEISDMRKVKPKSKKAKRVKVLMERKKIVTVKHRKK